MYSIKKILFLSIAFISISLLIGCQQQVVEPATVGDDAPDFCLKDIDDNIIILSYWKGSPIILRFWERDCMFCRADTPVFNEFYQKHKDKGLKVVYISSYYENLKDIRSFVQQFQMDFHVIMDTDGKLAEQFSVKNYPQTLTISPDHKITASIAGGVGEAELNELIGVYFNE